MVGNQEGILIQRGNISPTIIHARLRNYGLNIVKVKRGEKAPIELGWTKKVYWYDNFTLAKHLDEGGNYGVQPNHSYIMIDGVKRCLCVVDFDKKELQDKLLDKFPKTFTTTSGSPKGCVHLWFATDRLEKTRDITNEEGETRADIISKNGYIMCPGSLHPSGSIYKVVNDIPMVYLAYDEILKILGPYDKIPPKPVQNTSCPAAGQPRSGYAGACGKQVISGYSTNSFYDSVKSRLNVINVLQAEGIDTSKNPTECPFHSSESGKCLSFTSEVANCFHCKGGWNLFTLVRDLGSLDNKDTFEALANLTGLQDELKQFQSDYLKEQEERG